MVAIRPRMPPTCRGLFRRCMSCFERIVYCLPFPMVTDVLLSALISTYLLAQHCPLAACSLQIFVRGVLRGAKIIRSSSQYVEQSTQRRQQKPGVGETFGIRVRVVG